MKRQRQGARRKRADRMRQKNIGEFLKGVRTAAVAGHVNPDGDCVGSCLGVYNYIKDNYPETDVDVYLEQPRQVFRFMNGFDSIHTSLIPGKKYDLLILLDISSRDRIGVAEPLVDAAKKTLCFDLTAGCSMFRRSVLPVNLFFLLWKREKSAGTARNVFIPVWCMTPACSSIHLPVRRPCGQQRS